MRNQPSQSVEITLQHKEERIKNLYRISNNKTKAEAVHTNKHSFISAIDKLNITNKDSENIANGIHQPRHSNSILKERLHKKEEQLSRLRGPKKRSRADVLPADKKTEVRKVSVFL